MAALHELSLSEVCRRMKSGELSSVDVTAHAIARIDAAQPRLHAFALQLSERAMQQAQARDEDRLAGKPLGLLHGVPVAVKDLCYLEGYPTASGTIVMRDYQPDITATVVKRLEAAGAVIVGKTQLTEGAFGNHHPDIDAPVNPWSAEHWPGVSSSGSGVAVAARLAYGALGSDTGGSIRFPSASCGLVGIKPTYGRVSRYGVFPLAESLDHIGPMTRTVEDAARMLAAIAGQDDNDATSLSDAVPNYVAHASGEEVERLEGVRIGVDWRYVETGVAPVVVETVREALRVFQALGAEIVEVSLPPSYQTLVDRWGVTTGRECAAAHAEFYPAQAHLYGPTLKGLLDLGLSISQSVYDQIESVRHEFTHGLDGLLEGVDALIAPCMTDLPQTVEAMEVAAAEENQRAAFITFTAPFDYSGHPTITLPAGLQDGLPKSFQLVGRRVDEARLMRLGSAYEHAAPFDEVPALL